LPANIIHGWEVTENDRPKNVITLGPHLQPFIFITYIRLGCRSLPGTNTLAYYETS